MIPLAAPACVLLATSSVYQPAMGDSAVEDACLMVDADIAGRLSYVTPDPGIPLQPSLARGRLEVGLLAAPGVQGRFALDVRRSVPESGYLGPEGESLYLRAQIAEARYAVPGLGVTVAGGLVDDPWVVTGNAAFGFRPLAATLAEQQGWLDRSDLGGTATWALPHELVRVTASVLTGEGLTRRERNAGVNTSVVVQARPLAANEDVADALVVSVFGRNGSRGTLSARDHRLGARVHGSRMGFGYGVGVMKALGVEGDTDRTPFGTEAWGTVDHGLLTGAVRLDVVDQIPGTDEAGEVRVLAAVGLRPPERAGRPGHLVFGVRHRRLGARAASLAGGDVSATSTTVFAQVGVNLRATAPFDLESP